MAIRAKKGSSWFTMLLIAAAIGLWVLDQKKTFDSPASRTSSHTEKPSSAPPSSSKGQEKVGGYEVYRGCTLVENRQNDGDSFLVELPTGREEIFRLNFVDTPESAFRSYANGETNYRRIHDQATDLGGITDPQAVKLGEQAKHFSLGLLANHPFTIFTAWDSPFHDHRYHAHIEVQPNGEPRWLHQLLVEQGFVRLITKPADLPDGTPAAKEKEHLRNMEREAKRKKAGAWGLE